MPVPVSVPVPLPVNNETNNLDANEENNDVVFLGFEQLPRKRRYTKSTLFLVKCT